MDFKLVISSFLALIFVIIIFLFFTILLKKYGNLGLNLLKKNSKKTNIIIKDKIYIDNESKVIHIATDLNNSKNEYIIFTSKNHSLLIDKKESPLDNNINTKFTIKD